MFYIFRCVLFSCLCGSWAYVWSLGLRENELDAKVQPFIKEIMKSLLFLKEI